MVLHFGAERATRDIDVLMLRGNVAELRQATRDVGQMRGLPEDWLNDAAKGFADILPPGFQNRLTPLDLSLSHLRIFVLGAPDKDTLLSARAGMDYPIDGLFREWQRLGGAVLLAETGASPRPRPAEEVLAESTAHCRASGRLTWIVLDWLIRHADEVDERILLEQSRKNGDLAVLGVLCDAAFQRNPNPKFQRLMAACPPNPEVVPFFHRVAHSLLASRLARENALDLFRRWNFLSSELRYLSDDAEGAWAATSTPAQSPR